MCDCFHPFSLIRSHQWLGDVSIDCCGCHDDPDHSDGGYNVLHHPEKEEVQFIVSNNKPDFEYLLCLYRTIHYINLRISKDNDKSFYSQYNIQLYYVHNNAVP